MSSLELLNGKVISHAWIGHGSALFLELGTLSEGSKRDDGSIGNPQGEITIIIDFNWRVERQKSILGGSSESKKRCTFISKKLLGANIISAQTVGRIPELQLELSSGLWVVTFSLYEGQPSWAVLFTSLGLGALCVERGKLYVDNR